MHPLEDYITDLKRVLKPGAIIICAIPSEGGLAWGLGRFLTSKKWVEKNSKVNFNKIICWEHPNFSDFVINKLDTNFTNKNKFFWPFNWIKLIDLNLILSFKYYKNR